MVGLGKLAADPDILVWADRIGLVFWDWFSGTGSSCPYLDGCGV